jgi:ABC-2 type transport system ATP-binding protein
VLSDVLLERTRERGTPVVFSSHQLELVERLCDSVAIVKGGRLVASGRVEELRSQRAGNRWRIEVDGGDDWHRALDGVERRDGSVFELSDGVDPQAVLDAARTAGRVQSFGPDAPTLAELFRATVAADA